MGFPYIVHYGDVITGAIASQITSLTIVYSVYSDADERKHQSSASLAFVRGIHRGPVNSPHKWPVTRKMFHLMTSSCGLQRLHRLSAGTIITGICNSPSLMACLFIIAGFTVNNYVSSLASITKNRVSGSKRVISYI